MSTHTTTTKRAALRRFGRRGFLGTLGAGGVTAATTLFGKSAPAYAICRRNCCNLANCPNIDYNTCAANADYIWSCADEGSLICSCCEAYGDTRSAMSCSY
jgi:hypothetical protein